MTSTLKVDIAVVGAGLVGLAASIALERMGYSVAIIGAKDPNKESKVNANSWDQRIYAISPRNVAWLKELGVWQSLLPERIGEMRGMEIWGDDTTQPLTLSAEDANADYLGFIIEGRALSEALLSQLKASSIKTFFEGACSSLVASTWKAPTATIHISTGESVQCKVLLAADGANSWVRQQLNVAMQQKPYHQLAIVANFECEKSHADIARQWFAKDTENQNSILAWLPLPENKISIVWSVSSEYGQNLLKLSQDAFTQEVAKAGAYSLGELKMIAAPASFPLAMQKTASLVQDNVVFIGDAAHQIHPMAGQGMNLGFRDVIDFIEIMKEKRPLQSINDNNLLRAYERRRKDDIAKMLLLTDGLFSLFGSQNGAIKNIRNQGLLATNYLPVKKLLVRNAISL